MCNLCKPTHWLHKMIQRKLSPFMHSNYVLNTSFGKGQESVLFAELTGLLMQVSCWMIWWTQALTLEIVLTSFSCWRLLQLGAVIFTDDSEMLKWYLENRQSLSVKTSNLYPWKLICLKWIRFKNICKKPPINGITNKLSTQLDGIFN